MAAGTLWGFTIANNAGELTRAQTLAFTTLAMFQVFNSLNCRSKTQSVFQLGLFSNKYLIGAIALSVTLQIMANRLPVLQTALGTTPLSLQDWLRIVAITSSIFVADEIRKLVQGRARRNQNTETR